MKHIHLAVAAISATISFSTFAQSDDALSKIRQSGTVTIGVRDSSAPLSYALGGSKYVGYHVEICERVLSALLPTASVKYLVVTSQNRIPLLQNGTIDIECGSTSNTASRKQTVAFANTTYITEARFAVRASSGITSAEQLQGKTVVTTTGTTLVQRLRKLERKGLTFQVVFGKDHSDSFLLLESGRADAFAMDDNTLAGNIASARNPSDFKIVGEPLGIEPIAIMLRKDDVKFKNAVDGEIKKLVASGELQKIYNKWFMQPIPPTGAVINIPMAESLKAALKKPNDEPAEAYERN